MTKDNKRSLPPVIRVFLSSTFADMDKERSYFNEVIVPKLNRICAERGVSFFSVDLRWGITEEDQVDGKVLPICLSEIDKCRPYFIGIVGNRYGSILNTVPENVGNTIPWLVGKEGHSITELEMLYAVLEHNDEQTLSNCAFYLRSDDLTDQLYGHLKAEDPSATENLKKLKQTIEEDPDTPCSRYNSIEEFGSFVMRDILNWLDRHFPESEDVDAIRSEWYNSEILRNYIENNEIYAFLDSYINESKKPLLIYGDGARGKTASLTAWKPNDGHKVLINCGADDKYLYWPSIVHEIIKQLTVIAEKINDSEMLDNISEINSYINMKSSSKSGKNGERDKGIFFFTDGAIESFRSRFVQWLSDLMPKEKIIVVINDLNLLNDEKGRLLCWLPSTSAGNLKLIGTTNDEDMISIAEVIGWNIKEMPLFEREGAERFVSEYLATFGKSFSPTQLNSIISSEAARYPGLLKFIIRFLINHGRFENLDDLISRLSDCRDIQEIYKFIYDFLMNDYSDNEKKIASTVLGIVRSAKISLVEKECFELVGRFLEVSPIEWANICRALEQFEIIHGDHWIVRDEETIKFIDSILPEQTRLESEETIGDYIMELLSSSRENGEGYSAFEGRKYSIAAIQNYSNSRAWEKLELALENKHILAYLYLADCKYIRSGWMQLFLHSDVDMVGAISHLAREYYSHSDTHSKKLANLLIGILLDFELKNEAEILCDNLGIDAPGGTIDRGSTPVSDRFISLARKIFNLKSADKHRELYEYIKMIIGSRQNYTEMDCCQLLFYKSDCELRLGYYNDSLETANEYYRLALKMGYFFEMRRALSLRASVLVRLGRYDEAIRIADRTVSMACGEGEIRSYLGDLNLKAMIHYKMGRYDESIAIFDELNRCWSKIGDIKELTVVILNKCNALSYKNDDKEALSILEGWNRIIKNETKMCSVTATILGNMGFYAIECGEYDKAESYLRQSVEISKKNGFESTLIKSYNAFLSLYTKQDNFGKKYEIYTEKLELCWGRKEYEDLITTLKKLIEELLILKHDRKAADIERFWKQRFSTVKGGLDYFESRFKGDSIDSVSLDALEEQLVIARSEADDDKICLCYVRLANAVADSDKKRAVDYMLSALDILMSQGRTDQVIECCATALDMVIENGKTVDDELISLILERVSDDSITAITKLWQAVSVSDTEDIPELVDDIMTYIDKYELVISKALTDLSTFVVKGCTAEQLLSVVDRIQDFDNKRKVVTGWHKVMLSNIHQNEALLIKDYMSPEAAELIAYFEKCIAFLRIHDKSNAATLAGNIALIFRRRGDKEKTFFYHGMSMDIFVEENKPRDYLIEMTNLATAYNAFGEIDKAIDLLRRALDKANEVGDAQQRALIADNLADFLRVRGKAEDREETLQCFAIGESFFRSAGYTRDLVISLRNQVIYLINTATVDAWEPILKELTVLVRENQFHEFDRSITYFEWVLSQKKGSGEEKGVDEATANVESLVKNYPKGCKIESSGVDEKYFKFRVVPNEPLGGIEEIHIYYDRLQKNTVSIYMAFLPNIEPQNMENLHNYIKWWNGIGEYNLKWVEDNGYLAATMILMASEWDTVCDNFDRIIGLWLIDKTATLAIFSNACDVSDIQGMKLKIINPN